MNSKGLSLLVLVLLLVVALSVNTVPKCNAQIYSNQTPNLQISYSMYNWTADMKRLDMITPATGLVFKVTIYNNDTAPLLIGYSSWNTYYSNVYSETSLTIIVQVEGADNQYLTQPTQTITFGSSNELYLPANTGESFFVEFDQYGNSLSIGTYTAKVLYYLNSSPTYGYNDVLTGGTPIGQYPFTFQVESAQTLQNAISQNPNPSQGSNLTLVTVTLMILISVVLAVILSIFFIYFVIPRTRFKEKFADKTKKKYQLSELTGVIAVVLTIIQIIIALK